MGVCCTKTRTILSSGDTGLRWSTAVTRRIGCGPGSARSSRIPVALRAGLGRSSGSCPLPSFPSLCGFSCFCSPAGSAVIETPVPRQNLIHNDHTLGSAIIMPPLAPGRGRKGTGPQVHLSTNQPEARAWADSQSGAPPLSSLFFYYKGKKEEEGKRGQGCEGGAGQGSGVGRHARNPRHRDPSRPGSAARSEQGEGVSGPGCSHCSRSADEHPYTSGGEREARDRADVAAGEGAEGGRGDPGTACRGVCVGELGTVGTAGDSRRLSMPTPAGWTGNIGADGGTATVPTRHARPPCPGGTQVLRNLVQKAVKSEARMGSVYPVHRGGPEPIQNHLVLARKPSSLGRVRAGRAQPVASQP